MKRYLFILEVTPLKVGHVYDELPSHLTLMSRFFSDLSPTQLDTIVRPFFNKTPAIQLAFGRTEQLGPKKLSVHLVDYSKELSDIHNGLHPLLESASVEYEYPQFIGAKYKPHVTTREEVDIAVGDTVRSGNAYLIEIVEGQRVIRSKFALAG